MKRVYVIETHSSFVKNLKEVLNSEIVEMSVFTSSSDFSLTLEEQLPELFIVSLDLEGNKGLSICNLLHDDARTVAIPLLLTSSTLDLETIRESLSFTNFRLLKKPASKKAIAGAIHAFLGPEVLRISDDSATYSFEKFFDDIFNEVDDGPGEKDKKADSAYHITVYMSKKIARRKTDGEEPQLLNESRIEDLQKQLQEATDARLEKERELAEREESLQICRNEIETFKIQLQAIQNRLAESEKLFSEVTILQLEKTAWLGEKESLMRESTELQKRILGLEEELSNSRATLQKKESDWNGLNDSWQEENRRLSEVLQDKESVCDELQAGQDGVLAEKAVLERERDRLLQEHQAALATLQQEKNEQENALNGVIVRLAAQIELHKTSKNSSGEKLERVTRVLKEALDIMADKKIVEDNIEF